MSLKILRLKLKSLWNSEYTIFIKQLIAVITKYKPESLHLKKAFEKLTDFLPDIEKIKAQEQSNIISRILSTLDAERDILYNVIVAQVKTLGKVNLPAITPHVDIMKHFIEIHGDDIADAPYNAETKRLNDVKAGYDSKADVKNAAESLNLAVLFNQLFIVNAKFDEQFMQRTEEEAGAEKINVRETRKEIDKVLIEFYESAEHCSREYEELDYATLFNELNKLTGYYKTQLKARATRRESGKDVSSEPPIELPKE
jgi:hypothetical protein